MRGFVFTIAVIAWGLGGPAAGAGTSAIAPAAPTVADTVHMTYDTSAPDARIRASDSEIFVVVTETSYDDRRSRALPMVRDGSVFVVDVQISPATVFLELSFVTRAAYDENADLSVTIHSNDGSYPKGALLAKAQRPQRVECDGDRCNYDDAFDKELALHPDSYATYPARWALDRMVKQADFEKVLRKSAQQLPQEQPNETADLVYARFVATLTLGPPDKAETLILDLLRRFPNASETGDAYLDFVKASMMRVPGCPPMAKIDAAMREAINISPDGALARQVAQMGGLGDAPVATVEAICKAWAIREPLSPTPLLTLAHAYDSARSNTVEALALVQKALRLMFSGDARLAGDVHGYYLEYTLPDAYALEASLLLAGNDLPGAYAAAKAAAGGLRQDDPRGDILQGKIWLAAGDWDRAEKAFAAGLAKGTGDEARGELKVTFVLRHGSEEGFDGRLKALAAANKPKGGASAATLPNKTVKTLEGRTLDLAKLRGKIVVLNFFSLGCAPCVAEVPALNTLADAFKGNNDVVFLAPAGDDSKNLKAFVKKHPFRYQLIPADATLIPAFRIDAWPTHVIIGKDGEVVARLVGGSDSIQQTLKKKIEEQQ